MNPACPRNCFSNENNDLTLTGWLSEWILLLHVAPEVTLHTLVLLGYADDLSLLYTVTQPRQVDWEKRSMLRRNVAHAFLFGDKGVGKVWVRERVERSPRCWRICCAPPAPRRTCRRWSWRRPWRRWWAARRRARRRR